MAGLDPPTANSRPESRPPRLAERVLAAAIRDADWRDSIVGDLREEFAALRPQIGEAAARRWYWRQACAIGTRKLVPRARVTRPGRVWAPPELTPSGNWRTGMSRDLRSAWRAVVRQPGTSVVIVLTLALALATNSVSFAVLDALVLRPFRFPEVDRIVMVVSSDPQQGLLDRESVTAGDFADWRRESKTIKQLAAAQWWDANLSGIDQPEQVPGYKVTADFFGALGATPALGREFVTDEETPGNHRRVVIGHALWTRLFAADSAILGRMVRVDGEPHEVVGIAPPGFAIPEGAQMWAPLAKKSEEWTERRNRWLVTVGRLQDGATLGDARAEIGAIAERQRREYPETNADLPNTVVTFTDGMQDAGAAGFLSILLGASALLLLIACANIANLLLARGSERLQEFALRLALGGSRARLATQLMIEAALLSTIAVILAMPLAGLGLAISRQSIPPSIIRFVPGWQYLDLSPTLFAVTAAFGLVATVLFALVPALQTVRPEVADTLRQGARTVTAPRGRHWLRNSLATAQVALTLALLFGSMLMLSAVDRAVSGDMGFDRDRVLVARVALPEVPYAEAERRRQFAAGVLERVRAIPAVSRAAMISNIPYAGGNTSRQFFPDGEMLTASEARLVDFRRGTPDYFETLGVPLLAGRTLTDSDREGTQQVAVVSQSLVDRYWPDQNPLGRTFRLGADEPPITVVGVVGDVLHDWFQRRRAPTVYRPLAQDAPYGQTFVVRTVGDPMSVAGDLRRAVSAVDADQPILSLQSMDTVIADRTAGLTYISGTITVVAAIALALALMGLYSLMAYIISRRTQELGVRLALGATRWQIVMLTTGAGLRVTITGLVVGAALAFAVGRVMESALYGVIVMSVAELAAVIVAVATVSLLATYLPTRSTARLDPAIALRAQ